MRKVPQTPFTHRQAILGIALLLLPQAGLIPGAEAAPRRCLLELLDDLADTVIPGLQDLDRGQAIDLTDARTARAFARLIAQYERHHRSQEKIWLLKRAGLAAKAQAAETELKTALLKGKPVSKKRLSGSTADNAYLIEFDNGVKAVFKPQTDHWLVNHRAEIAVSELDRTLGLDVVPLTVERTIDGQTGSLQFFIEGAVTERRRRAFSIPWHPESLKASERSPKIRLLDWLINNRDRHDENYLHWSGQQFAIDHGMALRGNGAYEQEPILKEMKKNPQAFYPGDGTFSAMRAVTKEQLNVRLEPLLDEATRQGLGWRFDKFMEIVEKAGIFKSGK